MLAGKTVLVVDDDRKICELIHGFLEDFEVAVVEAYDGVQAEEKIQKASFDLIICDVRMPEMGGLKLLQKTRAHSNVRFLLISGFTDIGGTKEALDLTADGFLPKPFTAEEFYLCLSGVLSKDEETRVDRDSEFSKMPLDQFVTGAKLSVDVYLRLSSERYYKVGDKGGSVSRKKLQILIDKKIKKIYIKTTDKTGSDLRHHQGRLSPKDWNRSY